MSFVFRLGLVAWWAGALAVAAQPTVALTIPNPEGFVNEPLEVQLTVEDFSVAEPPAWPDLPTATVNLIGTAADAQRMYIINGRRTDSRSRVYRYEIIPREIGPLTIPSISVSVDGKTLSTRPQTIMVRRSDADELFIVEVGCGRKRVYVGQRIALTLRLWVKVPRSGADVYDANSLIQSIQPINFGPFPRRANISQQLRETPAGKQHYYTYDFVAEFVPSRPGPLTIDDLNVGFQYPARRGYRSLRPKPIFEETEVLAIPTQGRPPGFTGAVGIFDLTLTANPTTVRVGDPIELKIDLFGDGPIETLPAPDFAADSELIAKFRVPTETLTGEMVGSRRRYSAILRALDPTITELPPIKYVYFDPDAERFVIARSNQGQPIPLKVMPAERIDVSDIPVNSGSAPSREELQPLDGLLGLTTSAALVLRTDAEVSSRDVVLAAVTAPAAFAAFWGWLAYSQGRLGSPARRRRQTARRAALARLDAAAALPPSEAAASILAALAEYLGDRFNQPAARFTDRAGVEMLRAAAAPPGAVEAWDRLTRACGEASFGGGAEFDALQWLREAQAALEAVDAATLRELPS